MESTPIMIISDILLIAFLVNGIWKCMGNIIFNLSGFRNYWLDINVGHFQNIFTYQPLGVLGRNVRFVCTEFGQNYPMRPSVYVEHTRTRINFYIQIDKICLRIIISLRFYIHYISYHYLPVCQIWFSV